MIFPTTLARCLRRFHLCYHHYVKKQCSEHHILIGTPAAYFHLLHKNRDKIKQDLETREKDEELMSLSFLFDPYKPEYWYFEIIETVRRLLMTGVLSVIEPGSYPQLSYGLFLSVFFTILFSFLKPYHSKKDNWIAILSSAQHILVFLSSSFMKYNGMDVDKNAYDEVLMDALVITSHVFSLRVYAWWAYFMKDDLGTSTEAMVKKSLSAAIVPVFADDNVELLKKLLRTQEEVNKKQEFELKRKSSEVQALNQLVKSKDEEIQSLKRDPNLKMSTNTNLQPNDDNDDDNDVV